MSEENQNIQDANTESSSEMSEETGHESAQEQTIEEKLTDELAAEKNKFMRLFAEFDNFKKRTQRERIELFQNANEKLILELLPVLDDFERAMSQTEKPEDDGFFEGVSLIQNKLKETLKNKGLNQIEVNAGDDFDLEKQEAITSIPAPSEDLKKKIVDVVETGYMLNEKVIRYAKVVVGK